MSDLDTRIDGSPGSIRAVATWLRKDFGDSADELAGSVWQQRSRAASDWEGPAADGFSNAARTLGTKADDVKADAASIAALPEELATALTTAQNGMEQVRKDAAAGGLAVDGTIVRNPGPGPREAGPRPAADAAPGDHDAWQRADNQVKAHNAKVAVWNSCVSAANGHFQTWTSALEETATAWARWDKDLAGLAGNLITAKVEIAVVRKVAPILMAEADFQLEQASRARAHAEALKMPDGSVLPESRTAFYDFLDESKRLERLAPETRTQASNVELPKGLARGLLVVDVLTTGYAIKEDMESGESAAQATTSNVGGTLAAIGAATASGAYIGGVAGSFIPIPGVGTAVGVVGGAVVGAVVGSFTSGMIDGLWESGLDSFSDVGDAVMSGVEEVADLGNAVGDLASDAWNSIF